MNGPLVQRNEAKLTTITAATAATAMNEEKKISTLNVR